MNKYVRHGLHALTAFIIAAGGVLGGAFTAMMQSGATGEISKYVWLAAFVMGLMAAAKDAQALLADPPK